MRGTTRRSRAAGPLAVTLVALLAACSGGGTGEPRSSRTSEKAAVRACAGGMFAWSGVRKTDRLTGVAERQQLGKNGGKLTKPLTRVYTPRPSVQADGPVASPAEVLFSLGKKIGEIESDARTLAQTDGETWSFTDVHVKAPALDPSITAVNGPGDIVNYAGVREVAGDFRYTCPGGETVTGHARTWQIDMGGVLDCGESVDSDLALQAARRACPQGSEAAAGPDPAPPVESSRSGPRTMG
ncbi:hypothetical protein ACFYOV_13955 [Streptomyces sp. NPDC005931]|uniref:hypothetical protein n=1 Tax=Streptomyces sp. NPDC005931 TaxID=3364737 RepID=UPI0036BAF0B1